MKERLITTGGTIDKTYIPATGEAAFEGTHIQQMLDRTRLDLSELTVEVLMQLDSLDMTETQRTMIAASCSAAEETHIIITHGTDTMPETARHIKQVINGDTSDKVIILTGAMIPYSIKGSDALFNLGAAFAYVRSLLPGVYVCMNGRAFEADTVRKNKLLGIFETTSR